MRKVTYQISVAEVVVDDWVPNLVQICNSVLWGNFVVIPARVSLGVSIVYFWNGVERLVQISDVMDQKSQGKRPLIGNVLETPSNFVRVVVRVGSYGALEEAWEGLKSEHDIVLGSSEFKVGKVSPLVQVGLVIVVPLRLPPSVTFDLVRKRSTLGKRMVFLRRSVAREIFSKSSQFCKSCIKSLGSFFFKDSLCVTRDCWDNLSVLISKISFTQTEMNLNKKERWLTNEMTLVPEGCGLLDWEWGK